MNRIETFDILKGVGIILIIVAHTYGPNHWLWNYIYAFHMPLFFIVSGFLFRPQPTKTILKKNTEQLIVQYLAVCVIIIILTQIRHPHNIKFDI